MSYEVREFQVTVPAGTTQAAPQVTALTMPARVIDRVRVRVPPGPRGTVGWALGSGGQPVLPWNAGAWIVADDEHIDWALQGQIDSGAWQLIAYNTGTYAHTLYITFLVDPPQLVSGIAPAPTMPLSAASISGAGPAVASADVYGVAASVYAGAGPYDGSGAYASGPPAAASYGTGGPPVATSPGTDASGAPAFAHDYPGYWQRTQASTVQAWQNLSDEQLALIGYPPRPAGWGTTVIGPDGSAVYVGPSAYLPYVPPSGKPDTSEIGGHAVQQPAGGAALAAAEAAYAAMIRRLARLPA